ncbi:BnaCnng20290D [Brassica napus]|uniref:BnaCnng20290D protein n=2 Tax=Brassica TaxID=3705 RepID=A0A078IPY1_BRANA|nr:BnaCnng20290D [Brassica napus]
MFTMKQRLIVFCHPSIINIRNLIDTFLVPVTTNVEPRPICIYCFNSTYDFANLHLNIL